MGTLTELIAHYKLTAYLEALALCAAGYLLSKMVHSIMNRTYGQRLSEHGKMVVGRLLSYVIFIGTCLLALGHAGVNLSALLAAAGILTVAISFAAQTSASNVISGIFLLFDRPFSLGDTIKVDLIIGNVLSMGMLSSKVRTFDNLVVRIPNEVLLKSTIINYSLLNVRRAEIALTIAHENNLHDVQEMLLELTRAHPHVLDEPAPVILIDMIQDQGLQLLIRVWVERTNFVTTKSELGARIVEAVNVNHVKLPVMQRTVLITQDAPLKISHIED